MSACGVRPSVCLSRSWIMSKRIKISSKFFHGRVATPFQFSHTKRGDDIPTGTPLTGASNAGGVGKKTRPVCSDSRHTGLQCGQPYESRSVKNKAATDGGERRAHRSIHRPLFAQDDDEVFVTGSTLHAGDEGRSTPPPDTIPLVMAPFSAPVGYRRTEPGWYFCRKLTLTRTTDPIRPTRRDPDPNRPTNGSKQGGYDRCLSGGGGWSDTAGDNWRQQSRI